MSYAKKIHALLAKAAATEHAAERDTFTEAAERLMIKWGISDAMVEAAEAASGKAATIREKVDKRSYEVEGTSGALLTRWVVCPAASAIGPVRTVYYAGTPRWYAIGYPSDLARVELYIPQIAEQARNAWKRYLKVNRGAYSARKSFFIGFGATIRDRVAEIFEEEASSGTDLVLARRASDVDTATVSFFPSLRVNRRSQSVEADAYGAGRQAGREANLNAGSLAG